MPRLLKMKGRLQKINVPQEARSNSLGGGGSSIILKGGNKKRVSLDPYPIIIYSPQNTLRPSDSPSSTLSSNILLHWGVFWVRGVFEEMDLWRFDGSGRNACGKKKGGGHLRLYTIYVNSRKITPYLIFRFSFGRKFLNLPGSWYDRFPIS